MEQGCIVIQTCDKYQHIWENLFWSFEKNWDFDIPWNIYFFNEELNCDFPNKKFFQIKCGKNNHSNIFKKVLEEIKHDYIFYMLEDFWPTSEMTKDTFMGLFSIFKENDWNSLKVCCVHPNRYSLENTNFNFKDKKILKFKDESNWRFNQQASFWKTSVLKKFFIESADEEGMKTSLKFEFEMDKAYKKNYKKSKDYIYNYFWYPVGGVCWRGEINLMGQQIDFEKKVQKYIEKISND